MAEQPENYTRTVISDPVATTVYGGRAVVRSEVLADVLIRELSRATITTTVTTYDGETDEVIGDPVVTVESTDTPTGTRKTFPLDIIDFETAATRNTKLAELRTRILAWIAADEASDATESFIQTKLDTFLENIGE